MASHDKQGVSDIKPAIRALVEDRGALGAGLLAAVEAYPGPTADWRARLVTQALKEVPDIWEASRNERVVVVAKTTPDGEKDLYRQEGWQVYTLDALARQAIGESEYQAVTRAHVPRKQAAAIGGVLADMEAPKSVMWPVSRVLSKFYQSASRRPGKSHQVGKSGLDEQAVEWAKAVWDRQLADPIGSGLGLSRDAAIKYWHCQGAAWPDMAPDLPPRIMVVPRVEDFSPAELEVLLRQPCARLCVGDPAAGVKGAKAHQLTQLPFGSHQLGRHGAIRMATDDALSSVLADTALDDPKLIEDWVQSLAALSAISLGRHRPGFDRYRDALAIADDQPRQPPLAAPAEMPQAVLSRTGVASLEYLLDALAPGVDRQQRPRLRLDMDKEWSNLIRDAFEIAQIMELPREEWESKLAKRYAKGRDAALEVLSRQPRKSALIGRFQVRQDAHLYPTLKALAGIEYGGVRVIQSGGIKDASYATGDEARLLIGESPAGSTLMAGSVVQLADESTDEDSGATRSQRLYRALAQTPVRLAPGGQGAVDFVERATRWLDVTLASPSVEEGLEMAPTADEVTAPQSAARQPAPASESVATVDTVRPGVMDDPEMAMEDEAFAAYAQAGSDVASESQGSVEAPASSAQQPDEVPPFPEADPVPPALRQGFSDLAPASPAPHEATEVAVDAVESAPAADSMTPDSLALSEAMMADAMAHEASLSGYSEWEDMHAPAVLDAAPVASDEPALEAAGTDAAEPPATGTAQAQWESAVQRILDKRKSGLAPTPRRHSTPGL